MSNREELTLFSYEVLGLVGRTGAAPHDLLRMAQRGRMLAWAGESQYYTEPKRLAKLGYLSARKAPGKTRERTVYTLTDKGRQALAEIVATGDYREQIAAAISEGIFNYRDRLKQRQPILATTTPESTE